MKLDVRLFFNMRKKFLVWEKFEKRICELSKFIRIWKVVEKNREKIWAELSPLRTKHSAYNLSHRQTSSSYDFLKHTQILPWTKIWVYEYQLKSRLPAQSFVDHTLIDFFLPVCDCLVVWPSVNTLFIFKLVAGSAFTQTDKNNQRSNFWRHHDTVSYSISFHLKTNYENRISIIFSGNIFIWLGFFRLFCEKSAFKFDTNLFSRHSYLFCFSIK